MYTNILIPTDGSDLSRKAVEHGVALARHLGAKATFVTVTEPLHAVDGEPDMVADMPDEYQEFLHTYLAGDAERRLAAAKAVASAQGVECDIVSVDDPQPHRGIISTARKSGCDLIVMASHGRRGLSAIVLGSETVKVLTHSMVPVLVCR